MRRVAAGVTDALLAALIALLASESVGVYFAERAVVTLGIGEPDTFWRGPVPLVLGLFGTFVYGLPAAATLVLVLEPLLGATPGKSLWGLRVGSRGGGPSRPRALWWRFGVKGMGAWGPMVSLVLGSWPVGAVALAAAAAGALLPPPLIHDRIAGTEVRPVTA